MCEAWIQPMTVDEWADPEIQRLLADVKASIDAYRHAAKRKKISSPLAPVCLRESEVTYMEKQPSTPCPAGGQQGRQIVKPEKPAA